MSHPNPNQPWLNSRVTDVVFILSPPFFALLLVLLFPSQFQNAAGVPLAYWVFLIVFIDVAHVYSTLYRTYFNPGNFKKQYTLLIAIPLACYIAGVLIYHFDALWFWRILAYLAVYHFIRQQYGFMRLYSRNESASLAGQLINKVAIYTATLYPLLFWHLSTARHFNWFIAGDFFSFKNDALLKISALIYIAIIALYLVKEILFVIKQRWMNIPRNLLVAGTFLSWYFGIVYFNGDMAFTTLNVVSHGIPYMALIWFFEKKKLDRSPVKSKIMALSFGKWGIFYFLLILVLFAYLEEGLWDGLVWKEHQAVFKPFSTLPQITSSELLSLLVPLLALPQATHYVLDGFIWKAKNKF
ncbi:hypothetical protein [Pedobacter soli]|uniref:Uncharacterized protein n=1 Tax=Pedobacter soli TaxID=390242 RepID=A0A1G6W0D8_9SPHI|nr:hypothetical protein [Pedobacter soli]SDD59268.1 hypothetical protein SAMN04488024_106321 [Pedobacter soli]